MSSTNLFFDSIKRSLLDQDKGGNPYDLGYDAGLNVPNTTNCSFSIFGSKEATREWERGNRDGKTAKDNSVPNAVKRSNASGVSTPKSV